MSNYLYKIDHMLSAGKGRQILWLAVFVTFLLGLFWGINAIMGYPISFRYMISLMLSPGEFYYNDHLGFQVFVNLIGLVLVSSMLISLLSNIVENRVTAFAKGLVRYSFRRHTLFLGADDMLADTIKGQCSADDRGAIVVLTEQDAEQVRKHLQAQIQNRRISRRIIVLYGDRTRMEQLESVYAAQAKRIFILGENNEPDHDTKNILCLSELKSISVATKHVLDCYLLCNHLNTLRILQLQTEPLPDTMRLTVMNAPESWAQRVLVNGEGYPALYRKEHISADDAEAVHLVLLGCSQMAYAMAFTAAHTAHYPNFHTQGIVTRITMIAPDMDIHSDFLRSHYASLFRLSRWTNTWWTKENGKSTIHHEIHTPEPDYNFMDIDWEFISARVDTPEVRDLLSQWSSNEQEMLTICVCSDDMRSNLATALYLPEEVNTNNIPVLVYQSSNDALAQWTKEFTRYKNIYPFGMREDCYDPHFRTRLSWAKAANDAYEDNAARLNPQRKRKSWHDLKLTLQFSNIYSANYTYCVLRRVEPEFYARLEHQRWMTERLLLGYKAMTKAERTRIEKMSEADKYREMDKLDPLFMHPNIQPFEELTDESVQKDEVMVQSLLKQLKHLEDGKSV